MKIRKLKKLVAMALTLATVAAVSPVAASAAWKQDAKGWWNTEGNSWSIGWRQIDGKQQTVVVDYQSRVNVSDVEYVPLEFEQTSLNLFE